MLLFAKVSGSNKNNKDTVFADGSKIVSQNHEVTKLVIPHINMMPIFFVPNVNLLLPLVILGSSSKCQFSASTVQGPDGPVAFSVFVYVGLNTACAFPCSTPTSFVANWGTVWLGVTLGDLIAGIINMLLDALISFLLGKLAGRLAGRLPSGLFKGQMMSLLRRLGINRTTLGYVAGSSRRIFQSTSEIMVNKVATAAVSQGLSVLMGATPTSSLVNGGASAVGNWVDGLSQSLSGP